MNCNLRMTTLYRLALPGLITFCILFDSVLAQNEYPSRNGVHNQGNIQLTLDNRGNIALGKFFLVPLEIGTTVVDPYTNERIVGCTYPRPSGGIATRYMMQGNLLIGGIVGRDTLVTNSYFEMYADPNSSGNFRYSSTDLSDSRYSPSAVSSLDIRCDYSDTNAVPAIGPWEDVRDHIPLGITVTQESHAWSSPHIDDFIIIDLHLENVSGKAIKNAYVGYYVHAAVQTVLGPLDSLTLKADDVVGYIGNYDFDPDCAGKDSLWLSYAMDTDGDPDLRNNEWGKNSARSILGFRVVGFPSPQSGVNFNWFVDGFQPERLPSLLEQPRANTSPFVFWRSNDKEAYYYMSRRNIDYDQLTVWLNKTSIGWQPPPLNAFALASGARPFYLYSVGPFNLDVNGSADLAIAIVGGMNVHDQPRDYATTFAPNVPAPFYDVLDFTNFAQNARWAGWVYDNPGVDTDGDGYRGPSRICDGVPYYYAGDGVEDYKTDAPPVRPTSRVISQEGKITVRWNGFFTETTPDPLAGVVDFEGYRVYLARDLSPSSFTLLSSYDRENFLRFRYTIERNTGVWKPFGLPVTRDSLEREFGDPNFNPLRYSISNPLLVGGEYFYFAAQDFNAFDLTLPDGIRKVYPEATDPGNDPSLWSEDDVLYDYDEPLPKYYEYEYVIDSLIPTVPHFISVTSFDFGFPQDGIQPTETRPLDNAIREFALPDVDAVEASGLDVFVYPNPYRVDDNYEENGYEDRGDLLPKERGRRIYFANLPRVCTISIYSLDGDLIDRFEHNFAEGGPASQVTEWDMISRNNQLLVSGLYYYVVESATRTQIGKFVVIK